MFGLDLPCRTVGILVQITRGLELAPACRRAVLAVCSAGALSWLYHMRARGNRMWYSHESLHVSYQISLQCPKHRRSRWAWPGGARESVCLCSHGSASREMCACMSRARRMGRGAGNEEIDCRARRRRGREVAAGRRRDAGTSRLSRPRATFGCTGWRRARTGWRRAFGRADGVVVCGPARAGPTKHMPYI